MTGTLERYAPVLVAALLVGCSTPAEKKPADGKAEAKKRPTTKAAAEKPDANAPWEAANPVTPIPKAPLGLEAQLTETKDPPTPERVRLGRWLFYDGRLSADGTISCTTCHRPENAFSEPTPVSTGIEGQKGGRKAPTVINAAFNISPDMFWDGRAPSLEEQAKGPIENPIEMGNTHEACVAALEKTGYPKYFAEAFGDPKITIDRIAKAIADYERTRMSGNSPWDRWKAGDDGAVDDAVKRGDNLFFHKAQCNLCHLGPTFSDSRYHNLGIGWDSAKKTLADEGRSKISKDDKDKGAFKTPTVRDVSKHAPYMHDGSIATLADVIEHYDKGGNKNPHLSDRIKPLGLTAEEKADLLAMLKALDGEGYADKPPSSFPK